MNATSSRSHSIFTVVVECGESDARGDHIRVGKLNLVDLAGSERQSKVSDVWMLNVLFIISNFTVDWCHWRSSEGGYQDQSFSDRSG